MIRVSAAACFEGSWNTVGHQRGIYEVNNTRPKGISRVLEEADRNTVEGAAGRSQALDCFC